MGRAAMAMGWAGRWAIGALLVLSWGCGGGGGSAPATAPAPAPPGDIAQELGKVPGVAGVQEKAAGIAGARFFTFTFAQPVDHKAPGSTFPQTATLLFRSYQAPMVLASTGYGISKTPSQGEPTSLLQANQLTVEHRFFNASTPSPVDWSKLDILQAATDLHRFVDAFKPLFAGKWLNTGGSKGGMTSLFHRRFYPLDLDATLAYVAPVNLGNPDPRYLAFVDARGTGASRAALEAWQQAILDRRAEVRALLEADAARQAATLSFLGSDRALEIAVLEAPFTLWQYSGAGLAAQCPPPTATSQALYAFLDAIYFGVIGSVSDATLSYYAAYYYQCATQLGYPQVKESHLAGLHFPGQDLPEHYPPANVSKPYTAAAMQDVQDWVRTGATRLLLVYGENDPWSAGAFDVPPAAQARDNHVYIVPGGNHGARLAQLPAPQRAEAYALLSTWMGVTIPTSLAPSLKADAPVAWEETFLTRPGRR